MKKLDDNLYKSLNYIKNKSAAIAFSLAVFDGRMEEREFKNYDYLGTASSKDVFKNKITGLYLD